MASFSDNFLKNKYDNKHNSTPLNRRRYKYMKYCSMQRTSEESGG